MNRYLLVVDLQREFVKDRVGEKVYNDCLKYIGEMGDQYTAVIACVYKQDKDFVNMDRMLKWHELQEPERLDFVPDSLYYHAGYSIKEYPYLTKFDVVDIIGFDTDACVLSACFDIFNIGCGMRIIEAGLWSSGGKKMHEAGLLIMQRQFGSALDRKTVL